MAIGLRCLLVAVATAGVVPSPLPAQNGVTLSTEGRAACPAEAQALEALVSATEPARDVAIAEACERLAECLQGARAFADARAALEGAVQARERACPQGCEELFGVLHALGGACLRAGDPAASRAAFERALAAAERVRGPAHPDVAVVLNMLGNVCQDLGDMAAARASYERSLAIREKAFGPQSAKVAVVLNGLASVAQTEGDFAHARELYERALGIDRAALGADHPNVAADLGNLGTLLQAVGDLPGAQAALAEALRITSAAFPGDDPEVTIAAGNLARVLQARGDLVAARALFERALAIDERVLGAQHPRTATDLNNLAVLLAAQGDTAAAIPLFERALAIHTARLGDGHVVVAADLHNLAVARGRAGELATARTLLERALDIEEKALGAQHPTVGRTLGRLAEVHRDAGDLASALTLQQRGVAALEAALGPNHPDVATALLSLASIQAAHGESSPALAAAGRALEVRRRALGPDHPLVAEPLDASAMLRWRAGEVKAAREEILAAATLVARHIPTVLPSLSFAEQRVFVQSRIPDQTSYLLSACRGGRALEQAYSLTFRWKGLLIDALRRQAALSRLAQDLDSRHAARRLEGVRAQIAGWFGKAGTVPLAEWAARNRALTEEKEALERELARTARPGALEDRLATVSLAEFRALLAKDEAFVDVYRYVLYEAGSPGEERYAAVVVSSRGAPALIDLGAARALDRALRRWRGEVMGLERAEESWAVLRGLAWTPLARALPRGTRRVLLSPDGELARLPWHLLPGEGRSTPTLTLVQVDSARELALLRVNPPASDSEPSLLLAGAMDFDGGAATAGATRGGDYEPLPGTAAEVEALRMLGSDEGMAVTVLTGAGADKPAVTSAFSRVAYAHLATHGFFFAERPASGGRAGAAGAGTAWRPAGRNPLVESGIALAGANLRDAATLEARGLLTAEEIVGLDLSRCRLVTLSACETGRGEEITGQGVMGLRAAVLAAGSKSVLLSLWMVPDEATERLMRAFYSNLWRRRLPAAEALVAAQAEVRDDASGRFAEPIHWAGWVLAGEGW